DEKAQICDYPGNVAGCADAESDDLIVEDKQEAEMEELIVENDGKEVEKNAEVKEIETKDEIIEDDGVVVGEKKEAEEVKVIEAEDEIIEDNVEKKGEERVAGVDDGENIAPAEKSPAVSALNDDVDVTPSCDGRPDGFYARGCSSDMIGCSGGILSMVNCPAGLVFDERNQICNFPSLVAACASRDQLLTEDALFTPANSQGAPHPEIPSARDTIATPTTAQPTDVIDEDVQMEKEKDD
ncbi:hypothetical protein PMAYCL1PPCAC_01325, partial [Pristionchus mayeri]